MTLKQKTFNGLVWSFIDTFAGQGVTFIVGIILARILTPREFGLIGMITIFISISETFVNGGFKSALIQKKTCTQVDFSTAFFFNIIVGVLFYIILFSTSILVSNFFAEPELEKIIKVLGLIVIIDSLIIIQKTILYRRIDFKLQTKISLISTIISGIIAIILANLDYGIWALVALRLINQTLNCILLWFWNKWRPTWEFSLISFRTLFSFGSKLLIGSLLNNVYNNIYQVIIGKYYTAVELGYFTRANQFKSLPAENLLGIINRVSFPVLSTIQDDKLKLKSTYRRIIKSTSFLSFIFMMGLIAVSEPLIILLIGEKWLPSVCYLQLLCISGMFFPLNALNLNMLQVQGKAKLFLKLEIIKYILSLPVMVMGVFWGVDAMLVGMIVIALITLVMNSKFSGNSIDYTLIQQLFDILPSFLLATIMAIIVYLLGKVIILPLILVLVIQIITGIILVIVISELVRLPDYIYIRNLIIDEIKKH